MADRVIGSRRHLVKDRQGKAVASGLLAVLAFALLWSVSLRAQEPAAVNDEPGVFTARANALTEPSAGAPAGGNEPSAILAVACSPDGRLIAMAGEDKVVRLREIETGRGLGELKGHDDVVACLAFSPDGKTLASASQDGTARLWAVPASSPK